MAHSRDVAKEIKDFYVDTMSKVLFSYFKSYSGRLAKLQVMDEPNCYDISCEVLLLILFLNHWLKCRTFNDFQKEARSKFNIWKNSNF